MPKQGKKKPTGRYNEVSFPTRHRHRGARLIRKAIEARAGWGKLAGKRLSAARDTLAEAWGLCPRTLRNYTGKVLPPRTTWRIVNAFRCNLSPDEVDAIETALIPPDVAAARESYIEPIARRFDELIEGREDTIIPTDPAAKRAFEKFGRATAAFGAPPERISLGQVRVWVRLMALPGFAQLKPMAQARVRLLAQAYRHEKELTYQELRDNRDMIPNAMTPPLNRAAYDRPATEQDHPAVLRCDDVSAKAGRAAAGPEARALYQQAREPRRQRETAIIARVAEELVERQESVRAGRIRSPRNRHRSGR